MGTVKHDTRIKDVEELAMFNRGDIVEVGGVEFVVQEILISVTNLDIKYKVLWKHTGDYANVPEQRFTNPKKVGEMEERPYTWD